MTKPSTAPAPSSEPEASIKLANKDILDRVVELGRASEGGELVELTPPAGMIGLPAKVPALLKHGAHPELSPVAALFESYRTAPQRRKGTATVTTLASFVDLAKRHADKGSAIFANTGWPNPSLTAVLNYHHEDTARFGDHRISYPFPVTVEMRAWIDANGRSMSQGDFASFVEDRVADLASPDDVERTMLERLFKTTIATPAQMIELSRGLQVKIAATVKNAITLQSGETQLVWQEEHQNDKGERVIVPGLFMVSVPAFVDGDPVRIPARLRYRARDGKITWAYHLYKWDVELRERVKGDLDTAAKETGLPAFEGSPEA